MYIHLAFAVSSRWKYTWVCFLGAVHEAVER